MDKKFEYKTPRAEVRGVFLCENVADTAVSVLTLGVTQEGWDTELTLGAASNDPDGDMWLLY
jgi:hypothetical protein